ncbi:hypothetical protein BD410DRAFT_836232 [Rickenella mellea]|uniref:Uncharacterized protein n=1 Tax=Rickenella mellea TaxID=50990 RepID=A0A4Y7QJU8_9AGAM|nr:hypothetical protein BD410DRAFT_836232 [Rickenella mellea]
MYKPVESQPNKSMHPELHGKDDDSELLNDLETLDELNTATRTAEESTQEKLAKTFYYLVVVVLSFFLLYQATGVVQSGRSATLAWALASVAFHLVIPVVTMKLVPLDRVSVLAHFVLYYVSVVILAVFIIRFKNVTEFFDGRYPPNLFIRIVIGIMGFAMLGFMGFLFDRFITLWNCNTGIYGVICRCEGQQPSPAHILPLHNTDRSTTITQPVAPSTAHTADPIPPPYQSSSTSTSVLKDGASGSTEHPKDADSSLV